MDRTALASVALVVLVALTGCSGLFGGGTPTPAAEPTVTPTATPTATPGGPFAGVTFPEGTSKDAIDNGSALLTSHDRALAQQDYEISYNIDLRQGGQPLLQQAVGTKSSLDSKRAYSIVSEPGRLAEVYRNETTFAAREFQNNSTTYDYRPLNASFASEHRRLAGTETIGIVLRNANFSADAVITRRDGTTFVRYTLDEAKVNESANVTVATGTVVVSESGVVYNAELRIEGTIQGQRYLVDVSYQLVNIGNVEVDRPEWVPVAAEQAG